MADSESLEGVHSQVRDEILPVLGISEEAVKDLLAYRLLIERLGERQNNYWWDSQLFTEFGRESLTEDVPRTATRTRIELAQRVGRTAESKRLENEVLSLFDLGPRVESQIEHELNSIEDTAPFEVLEGLEMSFESTGWGASLSSDVEVSLPASRGSFEVASIPEDELDDLEEVYSLVPALVRGYGASTENQLCIPYISIE